MVDWVIEAVRPLGPQPLVVVTSPAAADAFGDDATWPSRPSPRHGRRRRVGLEALADAGGDVLVVSGDTPLLTSELLGQLLEAHRAESPAATALSAEPEDPRAYGRFVRAPDGSLRAIVEVADATPEQLAIREVGTSIYVFRADALRWALGRLDARNAQGELYLTDASST